MTSVTGRDGTPSGPRPGIGDHPTAMAMFGAIMLGLYDRQRTGHGSKVGTSLMASGAWAHSCDLQAQMLGATFPKPAGPTPIKSALRRIYHPRCESVFLLVQLDPEHEFPRLCKMFDAPEWQAIRCSRPDAAALNTPRIVGNFASQFESKDLSEWRAMFRQYHIKWAPLADDC